MKITKWHFVIGRFDCCWYDAWNKKFGLELTWGNRRGAGYTTILSIGF